MFGGPISESEFFSAYWRRKPCVFRKAINQLPEISNDTLLAVSAHPDAESRLILPDFSLQLGPFDLAVLPSAKGLLMLNGLDQHLASIDTMLQQDFAFLPRWRLDDVMASIGPAAASAGPHFDHYDVFLLQHTGNKNWQLDAGGHAEDELDLTADIRLLPEFHPVEQFELNPGDLLYVPPGVGHYGVNVSDSITLSIGIRNPTMTELWSDLTDFIIDNAVGEETVDDVIQAPNRGISIEDTAAIRTKLKTLIADDNLIADWYGSYSTRLREPKLAVTRSVDIDEACLTLAPYARLTWFEHQGMLRVYANGAIISAPETVLAWLCPLSLNRRCTAPTDPEDRRVVTELAIAGVFAKS